MRCREVPLNGEEAGQAGPERSWSARLVADGLGVVTPTEIGGETMTRICVLNPRTTAGEIAAILDTMA